MTSHTVSNAVIACALTLLYPTVTAAQTYPAKPIRFVVSFPPGGGTDQVARLVAPKLTEHLGQQVIVENRGGAGGTIGAELAARAAPDGYTIFLGSANLAMAVGLYPKWPINPTRDFIPVALLASTPNLVVVHPSLPVKSIKDLVALAKARPGAIDYASGGSGSSSHLATELLKSLARINIVHVPYKGHGPAVVALLGGEAPLLVPPVLTVLPHVHSGRVRALGITSVERSPTLPDIPTVAESGLPGYQASQWYGVMVPAGTPDHIVDRLSGELVKIAHAQDFTSRMAREAATVKPLTRQPFSQFLREEVVKWTKVVRDSGATAN